MTVTRGKLPEIMKYPFSQLVALHMDANLARLAYQNLYSNPNEQGLIIYEHDVIQAVLLYHELIAEHLMIDIALIWPDVNIDQTIKEILEYFSKKRIKKVYLKTLAQSDSIYLEHYGFDLVEDGLYCKVFSYPIAFVFGGGGAHGAFLTGAYEALRDHGLVPNELIGVSVGAITGVSLMHFDTSTAKETWANLTTELVYEVPEVGLTKLDFTKTLAHNFFSRQYFKKDSLRKVIRPVVEKELASERLVEFSLVATEFPRLKEIVYTVDDTTTVDELTTWILASSAFYPAVAPVEIAGKHYVDGGYSNSVPANVAAEHGAKEIYAITIMDGVPANLNVPDDVRLHIIRSPWQLGPLLDFMPDESAKLMQLGHLRAKQVLGELDGYYYAFEKGTDFSWLGGSKLIAWLAIYPATAEIARCLQDVSVWLAWITWLQQEVEYPLKRDNAAIGLATIERLAKYLGVDPLLIYTEQTIEEAIVKAGRVKRFILPLPRHAITKPYVLVNMGVVLTGILFMLSNLKKTSKIMY